MRLRGLAVAVLGAALLSPASAQATFPGDRGRIAFVDTFGDPGALRQSVFTARPDGTGARRLLDGEDPAYSPSGKSIAFTTESEEIWLARSDGSRARRLLSDGRNPSWRSDGKAIAFERWSGEGGEYPSVWVYEFDSRGFRNLGSGADPAFSPTGGRIVFFDILGEPMGLYTMGPRGSGRQLLHRTGNRIAVDPDWSPGRRAIAVGMRGRVAVLAADGTFSRWVTPELGNDVSGLSWSPDGRRIVYADGRRLYTTGDRGGAQRRIGTGVAPAWQPRP